MSGYKLKLKLIYEGVKISKRAKKALNNGNYINDDYITTSGIIINFDGIYANVVENEESKYLLDYCNQKFILEF